MDEIRVFVSYSHENDIWLQEWLDKKETQKNPRYLLGLWERTFRNQPVVFWHDRNEESGLRGGDRWRTRILEEIDHANVAVLLVTQDFIVSPFIRDEELPRILDRSRQGKIEILPILLEPAHWKDLEIHGMFQITPGKPTPLSQFESSDHEWKTARNEVLEALQRTIARAREKKNPPKPGPKTVPKPAPAPTETILQSKQFMQFEEKFMESIKLKDISSLASALLV
ncbi:MAG: toll/interleukin-1 receptor domain-containing protein, partial [Syntrophaceae bacterium]|nr:toll/interleukin-1 receptor domain-containing protein [Syntrophaceae bacterium]